MTARHTRPNHSISERLSKAGIVLWLVGCGVSLWSCTGQLKSNVSESASKPSDQTSADKVQPTEVTTLTVTKMEIFEPILFAGIVEPALSSQIFASVDGTVAEIKVHQGQEVQKNEVLALIQPRGPGTEFNFYRVRAPMAGTIQGPIPKLGSQTGGALPLFQVADLRRKQLRVAATAEDINQLKKETRIDVLLRENRLPSTDPGQFAGTLTSWSPDVDPKSMTHDAVISIGCSSVKQSCQDQITALAVGSLAFARVAADVRRAVVLPTRLFSRHQDQVFVAVKDDSGQWHARKRLITLGLNMGSQVEVTSGLDVGEMIIDASAGSLKDGAPILIQNSQPGTTNSSSGQPNSRKEEKKS